MMCPRVTVLKRLTEADGGDLCPGVELERIRRHGVIVEDSTVRGGSLERKAGGRGLRDWSYDQEEHLRDIPQLREDVMVAQRLWRGAQAATAE